MMKLFDSIQDLFLSYRRLVIILGQLLLIPFSFFTAFLLRFDFTLDQLYIELFLITLPFLLVSRLICFYYFDLFSGWWRYVGLEDIFKIANAVLLSSLLFIASVVFVFGLKGFPRSVFIIDALLLFLLLCGIRVLARLIRERRETRQLIGKPKNVLIVGAGNTGVTILNEIKKSTDLNLKPIGFIDNDPSKAGIKIRNLKVLGNQNDLPKLLQHYQIDEVLIAIPSAPYKALRKIVELCEDAAVTYKALPGMSKIISGKTFVSQMRDVHPHELLGRHAVSFVNEKTILQKEIHRRCILVTGAGGSIGSELCRQIAGLKPRCLIMYERNESNLYFIDLEIRKKFPNLYLVSMIGDILNRDKFEQVLATYTPNIIYHAAAYKHVPLMEREPMEAVKNNFLGSKVISDLSVKYEVKKFIFISTDKAVNPTSVMGTTKRMTEKLLQTYGPKPSQFISVRFGNIIGSSGSMIPLFKKQIIEGGPVTVTHPEATRFLMTIPEAVQLVLLAGAMGVGDEIFLLDMGNPANIDHLARNLIQLSGLTPEKDIDIEYIGLREGEKLHEELYWVGEDILPTAHKKIWMLPKTPFNYLGYKVQVSKVEKALEKVNGHEEILFEMIKDMVPESTIRPFANHAKNSPDQAASPTEDFS